MTIKNDTKQTILSENVTVLKTNSERMKGLIGEKTPKTVMFQTRFGIHTFFMKFPIDVVVLDHQNKIVTLSENLKPNRFFFWNPLFSYILELPAGTIKKTRTEINDVLLMQQ